jgi:hypothetical protein
VGRGGSHNLRQQFDDILLYHIAISPYLYSVVSDDNFLWEYRRSLKRNKNIVRVSSCIKNGKGNDGDVQKILLVRQWEWTGENFAYMYNMCARENGN